jgi:mono/diheme cytochrome c family protein
MECDLASPLAQRISRKSKMSHLTIKAALVGGAFVCAASTVLAQAKPQAPVDPGALEYRSSCAVCHGLDGKGNGPTKPALTKHPTNLTTLAKGNGGVFPVQRVYEVIDGRQAVTAHGTRDMPIWGTQFLAEADFHYRYMEGMGPHTREPFVRARVMALVDYLNRIQVK